MVSTIVMYGIPNCSKVKNARDWLTQKNIDYTFIDYKKQAPTEALLTEWAAHFGWDLLLNKQGTTWRGLSDEEKNSITTPSDILSFLLRQSSAIKRPLLVTPKGLILGFDIAQYEKTFA